MTMTGNNDLTVDAARSTLVDGLNHVALASRDLDRLAAFYAEVFDVPFVELAPPAGRQGRHGFLLLGRGATAQDPGPVIHVFEVPEAVTGPFPDADAFLGRGRLDHLAIEAAGERELCDIRDRLVTRGASDGTIRVFGGWFLSVHVVDPDGMRLEVGCRRTGEVLGEDDVTVEH
jgi:catechol 2,3-dioxygenase-like lactoylglutathione lyase family enzyme